MLSSRQAACTIISELLNFQTFVFCKKQAVSWLPITNFLPFPLTPQTPFSFFDSQLHSLFILHSHTVAFLVHSPQSYGRNLSDVIHPVVRSHSVFIPPTCTLIQSTCPASVLPTYRCIAKELSVNLSYSHQEDPLGPARLWLSEFILKRNPGLLCKPCHKGRKGKDVSYGYKSGKTTSRERSCGSRKKEKS